MHRSNLIQSGSLLGASAVILGLLAIGLFYFTDLLTMFALPLFTTRATAMGVMKNLHLNLSWIVMLFATFSISLGFAFMAQRLFLMIDDLEKANRVKNEFLSVISHEIRTPLNTFIGYTEMVRDKMLGEVNQQQEEALGKAFNQSNNLLSMINSVLLTTQIDASVLKVESHEVHLGEFLDQLKSTYDVPLAQDVALIWNYESNLPSIKTDRDRLKHVLQNLINNGIKFTQKGQVAISLRHIAEAGTVEFKVADTGIGISKENLSTIFEKFRQVDSSETRLYGGMGLGLHIVKKLTELLGGKIEVESEPGKGSTFRVTIPCAS